MTTFSIAETGVPALQDYSLWRTSISRTASFYSGYAIVRLRLSSFSRFRCRRLPDRLREPSGNARGECKNSSSASESGCDARWVRGSNRDGRCGSGCASPSGEFDFRVQSSQPDQQAVVAATVAGEIAKMQVT